jgi:DNA-binding CsgD family transcriptional regulator
MDSNQTALRDADKADGTAVVKRMRVFPKIMRNEKRQEENVVPDVFLFCQTSSGTAQFRATSGTDLECTVERIAGQLAMQCLVRGQHPTEFQVLVPAERSLVGRLISRAEELLTEGRSIACPTSLSARQREVLDAVLCNRANKEIASKLNITVRTVKFHISSLLSKFGVETRAELARRASGFMRPQLVENETASADQQSKGPGMLAPRAGMQKAPFSIANKSRDVRFGPGRILTA